MVGVVIGVLETDFGNQPEGEKEKKQNWRDSQWETASMECDLVGTKSSGFGSLAALEHIQLLQAQSQ
jgi:hypothetical protein